MTRYYLDTSAALKLVVEERESQALARLLDEEAPELVACWLLETELRRAATRIEALTQAMVTEVVLAVNLLEMPSSLYREAGLLPGPDLRSLDALHLAAASRADPHAILTYDVRLADAATSLGVPVLAPS